MALELIKDLSPKSWVSQRLWRTVKSLQAYAPKLGLQQDDMSHSRESTALAMAGMATNGGPQHALSSTSTTHRGSTSSAGHQPTPSPAALTPGYGGPNHNHASRMRSSTPHGGASPLPISDHGNAQAHGNTYSASPDDKNNGIRLQTEMLRMYEGFGGGMGLMAGGADEIFEGALSDYSANGGHYGTGSLGEGVFPLMKEMF